MHVALFDRVRYDDLDLYRERFGTVTTHTRFNWKAAAGADVVVTTYTKLQADVFTGPVVACDTDAPVAHLSGPVEYTRQWQEHDTALTALRALDPDLQTVVVGMGRIGTRVYRHLLRAKAAVAALHHYDTLLGWQPEQISLHLLLTPQSRGWLDRYIPSLQGARLVNVSRRGLVSDTALLTGLANGNLSYARIDGGPKLEHPQVEWTPHTAWQGDRSARLRPQVVVEAIEKILQK